MIKRILVLIASSCLAGPLSAAALSQVAASVDWSLLDARLDTAPISTFDFIQSSTIAGARAEYVDGAGTQLSEREPGWGDLSVTSAIPNAQGHGYASADSIHADASAVADGVINTYGRATANAYRIGYFSVDREDASYTLNYSIPFSVRHVFDYDPLTDGIGGYSYIAIGVYYLDPADGLTKAYPGNNGDNRVFSHYGGGVDDWNGTWTDGATLSVRDFQITGYRTYAIDAFVYSDAGAGTTAVIPEPGPFALFALGLASLAASRRRAP